MLVEHGNFIIRVSTGLLESSFNSMGLLPYDFPLVVFAYNINKLFSTCGAFSELVLEFE